MANMEGWIRVALVGLMVGVPLVVSGAAAASDYNISLIDIGNGTYTHHWFDGGNMSIHGFIYSLTSPMVGIMGYWFYAVSFFLFTVGVYLRGGQIQLPLVIAMIVGSVWGVFMPPESAFVGNVLMGLAVAAIFVKVLIDRL